MAFVVLAAADHKPVGGPLHRGMLAGWPYDIPAAMITNTAYYRNTAYHTEEDTAYRLDYERMGMVVAAVHAAIMREAAK